MQPDLVQRSRAGDLEAFAGLVALWGDRALQIALVCTPRTEVAVGAVAGAFGRAYHELPALHPRVSFRPWLMGLVLEAAGGRPRDERLKALQHAGGQRAQARADRAIVSHLASPPKLRLPERFFTDEVEPTLQEPVLRSVERAAPRWRIDDLALIARATTGESAPAIAGRTGMSRTMRGAQPGPRRSRDLVTVLQVVPRMRIAWASLSRFPGIPGSVDAVYLAEMNEDTLRVSLRGIALLPVPLLGGWWSTLAERGLAVREERLRAALALDQG